MKTLNINTVGECEAWLDLLKTALMEKDLVQKKPTYVRIDQEIR